MWLSQRFAAAAGVSCPRRIVLGRIVVWMIVASGVAAGPSLAVGANIYWDGLGTTWNSTTDWSTASNATTPHPAAVPGASDIAIFDVTTVNTAQTVTLDALQSALGLDFTSTGTVTINNGTGTNTLTIGASGITVAGGAGADTINANLILSSPEIWTNNSTNALTVNGNISNGSNTLTIAGSGTTNLDGVLGNGNGGLIMSGSGTLHFTGNNTFTGGLTINSGEVQLAITATGALNSTTPNTVTFGPGSTGTLTLNADSVTIGGLNSNGGTPVVQDTTTVSLGATLTIGNTGSNSFGGVLQNGGPGVLTLVKSGIGSQTLSGNNTFTGGLTVQNGTLMLSGNNTFSGGLVVSGGTLAIPAINNVGSSGTLGSNTSVTLGSSGQTGTLEYTGTTAASSNMPFVLAPGGTGRFQVDNSNSSVGLTLSGVISGSGGMTVSGNGFSLLTLTGNNTFSGGLTIQRGILAIPTINNAGANGPLGNNTSVTIGGPPQFGALEYTGASASSNMPFVMGIADGGEFLIPSAATNLTLSGVISGGLLELNGPGTLTLTGNNTFTGGTAIEGATLRVSTIADSGNSNLANSGVLYITGGTLDVTGGGSVTSREVVVGVAQSVNPTIQIDGGSSLTLNGQVHNALSQSTTLNVIMPSGGTLTLGGFADNSALDLNVESGTVILAEASSGIAHAVEGIAGVSPGATVQLAGTGGDQIYDGFKVGVQNMNGTLDFNGRNEGFDSLSGTGTVLNNGGGTSTMTLGTGGSSFNFVGTIADNNNSGSGKMALVKTGAGILTLSDNNSFTGGLSIQYGTLAIPTINNATTNGTLGNNTSVTLGASGLAGTLEYTGTTAASSNMPFVLAAGGIGIFQLDNGVGVTLSGVISGSGGLYFSGNSTSTLTLTGNNTFSGELTILSGTLAIPTFNNAGTNGPLGNNASVAMNDSDLEYTGSSAASNMPFALGILGEFRVDAASTNLSLSGAISGSGELNKLGPGTLTLSGNNSFTGGTGLVQGTLSVATIADSGNSNLGNSGTLFLDGGTLEVTGDGNVTARPIRVPFNSTIQIDNGNNLTLTGPVFNNGTFEALTIVMPSGGTLTLGGAADNSNLALIVQGGTVILAKSSSASVHAVLGIGGVSPGATVRLAGSGGDQISDPASIGVQNMNGIFDFNGRSEGFDVIFGTGTVLNNGSGVSTMTLGTGGSSGILLNVTIADNNNGGGGKMALVKVGGALIELSGNNTFTGGVTINGGELVLGNAGALNSTVPNAVAFGPNSTGVLALDGFSVTVSGLNSDPMTGTPVVLNGSSVPATLTVNTNGSNTFAGVIQDGPFGGALSLTKTGTGTLILSGNNTATGPININGGTLAESGGGIVADVHNQVTFVYNAGTFAGRLFNAGAVTFNAPFTAGNGMENDSSLAIASGQSITLNGLGLDNEGTLTMYGGTLALSSAGGAMNVNRGNFNLSAALNLAGVQFTNQGSLALSGGLISGTSSTLTNTFGGTISGTGSIQSLLANSGGLLLVGNGTMNVTQPFASSGSIQLTAAASNLEGGAITSTGLVRGFGNIGSALTNNGNVEALGGILYLSGNLTNSASGLLTATAGNQLVVTAGLATNPGIINLTGGTFDNNNRPLNNTGEISGWGIFRTGGTGLDNHGSITFSGGLTTVNGPVTNEGGKTITIAQNPAIFTGLVTNNMNGTFDTVNATATFAGGFTNNGNSNFAAGGNGAIDVPVAPALGSASSMAIGGASAMRFSAVSGAATVGTGVTATVSNSATLELAGTVSALSSGANRVDISNTSSAAAGILVSGTNQQVGSIDGSGTTQVNAGSDLTANHIIQAALVIGGTAKNPGLVTIDASDASGNPLDAARGGPLDSGAGDWTSANLVEPGLAVGDSGLGAPAPTASAPNGTFASGANGLSSLGFTASASNPASSLGGDSPAVPEPSTLPLILIGVCGLGFATRRTRPRCGRVS